MGQIIHHKIIIKNVDRKFDFKNMFGENPMLVPVKQEEPEPEPETIEQKIEKVGEFTQNQCYTDKEYQELMTGIYNQMSKLLMPNEEPATASNLFQLKPLIPSKKLSRETRRCKEKKQYNLFLQKVAINEPYSAQELTKLYNETFQSDINTRGFGRLNETKENFHVFRKYPGSKKFTGYIRYG